MKIMGSYTLKTVFYSQVEKQESVFVYRNFKKHKALKVTELSRIKSISYANSQVL